PRQVAGVRIELTGAGDPGACPAPLENTLRQSVDDPLDEVGAQHLVVGRIVRQGGAGRSRDSDVRRERKRPTTPGAADEAPQLQADAAPERPRALRGDDVGIRHGHSLPLGERIPEWPSTTPATSTPTRC